MARLLKAQQRAVLDLCRKAKADDKRELLEVFNELAVHPDPAVADEATAQLLAWVKVQRTNYRNLGLKLAEVEQRHTDSMNGIWLYLRDGACDDENARDAGYTETSLGWYAALYRSAAAAAGQRAEEAGIDVNAELGFNIY